MDTGMWPTLPDAERDQWVYLPGQTLGPLRMDMHRKEVVATLAAHGFATQSDGRIGGWDFIHFAKEGSPVIKAAVECYFHEDGELAYVLVDGRFGPQVACEGIRLIGRVPSQLAQEMEDYAIEHDTGIRFSYGGDCFCDGFQLEIGAQRASDHVVSWALFFIAEGDPSLPRDAAPAAIWHRW
ncbi:hypothetical protein GT030_30180 [Streptomyces sp. SID1328]|uniref:hypothetical protein n=1 Tax=Streptomyces sp. SID1328 TaxID=2690250 RepID=UPI00136DA9DC|nr:hypothetical protein [Streptomyces sp. SID1328]MYV43017.1 hypothetical protein [Streptomyces sp. SID1328]